MSSFEPHSGSPSPAPTDVRARIELAFERWARFAMRRRWTVLVAALLATLPLAAQLPGLGVDNSTDSFLRPENPIRVQYDAFREQFGRDTRITFAIESDEIFSLAFLERLRDLHRAVEAEVPYLDEVQSLINARDTRGEGDTLVVGELLDDWPATESDLEALRERVLANPLYKNNLISADGGATMLAITPVAYTEPEGFDALSGFGDESGDPGEESGSTPQLLSGDQEAEAVAAAYALRDRFEAPDFKIYLAGQPVMSGTLNKVMVEDIRFFMGVCLFTIAVFLALLFRRVAAVVLPVGIVVLSLVAVLGIVALAGAKIGPGTQILPSFLMSVGVCDAVHILAIFYLARGAGRGLEDSIAHSMRHSALAILMTSLTTAGGLASFVTAELAPVGDIGRYAPIGVMLAFVYTVVLMPALMVILPMGQPVERGSGSLAARLGEGVDRTLRGTGAWSARHRLSVLIGAGALSAAALAGASFLHLSHNPMEWFPEEEEVLIATDLVNDRFGGANAMEVLIDFGREGALKSPENLAALGAFEGYADDYRSGSLAVSQTISILDVLRETNRALHANDQAHYRVPDDAALISQELLLFEGSGTDDLEELTDTTYAQGRMTLRVPWIDALYYPKVIDEMGAELERRLGPDTRVVLTGQVPMLSRTFLSMIRSMVQSYAIALVVIVPLMMLLLGSVRLGLVSMLPNLLPIAVSLGYLGWSNTPIDGMTMMTGAIILGLAVDDTIHFMHNFRRSYAASGDSLAAIDETLAGAGRALLITTLVLAAGFTTFGGAYALNVQIFGLLTAGAITVAFVSNIVVGSAIVSYASEWGVSAGRGDLA